MKFSLVFLGSFDSVEKVFKHVFPPLIYFTAAFTLSLDNN